MSSISGDDAYHARLRARVREYQDILASSNPVQMIMDTPTRRGHVQSGNSPYMAEQVFGGREYKQKKTGMSKAFRTVGNAVKPIGKSLRPIKHAAMERAVYELGAPMYERPQEPVYAEYTDEEIPEAFDVRDLPPLKAGRAFNQKKQGTAKFLRTVGNFVKPAAKTIAPIKKALVARAVDEIENYGGAPKHMAWAAEVKAVREEMAAKSKTPVSYKMAMMEASKRRHAAAGTKPAPKVVKTAEHKAALKAKRDMRKAAKSAAVVEQMVASGRY